jgi:hypothetical protein
MNTSPTRKPTRTYTMAAFCAAMEALNRSYKKRGNVVDVDWNMSGHFDYKCTPAKGMYITSSGKGGTIYQLLHSAGSVALSNSAPGADTPPLAGCEAKPTGKKSISKDLAKVIDDAFPRTLPEAIITGTSSQRMAARRAHTALEKTHRDAWRAVSSYLESRGLSLADIPAHAKVSAVANGYDLIIPLANLRPGEPAAHFTLLTKSGAKRPEAWLEGDCRYTKGPQRTPAGGAAHAIIRAAENRLEIPGASGVVYCIGEGLESSGTGNKITGHASVFAVTRGGVAAFLDDPTVVKGLVAEAATLLVMVDRDISGDGQKSAAILARKAKKCGIPVLFCVPPMIVKGGAKGADWNDALMELGLDGARGALLQACAESDAALAAIPDTGEPVIFHRRRTTGDVSLSIDAVPDLSGCPVDDVPAPGYDEYLQMVPGDISGNARCKGSKGKPRLATATEPTATVTLHTLDDAAAIVARHAHGHIHNENEGRPLALVVSPGVGKSHIWAEACDDAALLVKEIPTLTIAPTRSLAFEAAEKNGGVDAPARNGVKGEYGYCNIHPEISPFSESWRSIVAHKCKDCEHGKAAMAQLGIGDHAGEDFAGVDPCAYLLQTENSRKASTLSCTGQKANTDDAVFAMKQGKARIARRAAADDFTELNDHKMLRQDQIAGWVRSSNYVISRTLKSIIETEENGADFDMSSDNDDFGSDLDFLKSRKVGTEQLKSGIEHLLQFLAANSDDEQKQLNPADFTVFCDAAENKALDWMDGTSAEAVYKDREGHLEIPLRAVRDTATAIRRGTAWVRKGYLHIAVPTFLPAMIKNGGMVMDATILPHVRMLIEAHGGEVVDVYAESATRIRQHFDGAHTKTSCDPSGKNFGREKRNFLLVLKAAIAKEGDPARLCVMSHMAFILAIMKDILALGVPEAQVGWFNRHDRGQNDWYQAGCTRLFQWGVMRLSGSVIDRMYTADRQVAIEAGGDGGDSFNADREAKVYRIPGTDYESEGEGFVSTDVDRWERSRITAQTMQASGRLRGTRRVDAGKKITHDIHSSFIFSGDHGFRVDEVITDAAFQTRDGLNAERADDSERRAVIGLKDALKDWASAGRSVKAPGRDKVNGYLRAKNINEISSHSWNSVLKSLSVQALYDIYTMPARIAEKTGEIAYLTDLYGESVSKMYQSAVDSILSGGGDPADPAAIRVYFDKKVDAGEYSSDLDVVEGLLMECAVTIQRALATGTGGKS